MVAASLEALARPAPYSPKTQSRKSGGSRHGRNVGERSCFLSTAHRENPDVLTYFEEATPVQELEHARIGSRPTRRSANRAVDCAPFPGSSAGCKAAMFCRMVWVGYALEQFAGPLPQGANAANDG